jgi:tetratricopeptide (TPR) repeat protein
MAELDRPVRVFISSASGALAPYRRAAVEVCHRLDLTPVHMEDFDPERPGEERSYTELEYEWALAHPGMSLLPFVVDPAFAWPPLEVDRGADAEALDRFIQRVRSGHTAKRFGELAAFREDMILALKPYETAPSPRNGRQPSSPASRRLPSPPAFHAVPPYVGSAPFTGRVDDLAALDAWARSPDPVMVVEAIGGTGKSALTWEWAQSRAAAAVDGLAGRFWWSFYDGSASISRFLRELLAYVSNRPLDEVRRLDRTELSSQVLAALRSRPYLLVLDGFERLLAAYHRFDPSKLRDEEVEPAKRSLIEPHAEEVTRALTGAGPSKILISSRLMPNALEGRFVQRMPGVRHLRLPGLSDADTITLLDRLGVRGDERAVTGFFGRLGNHPLLVGIVAGLVRDYRPDPGGFERWLADPTAGGILALPDLDLSQRRAHILDAALAGLQAGHRRLLGWVSVLAGAVKWDTLEAINPFRPEPPTPVEADFSSLGTEPAYLDPYDDYQTWPLNSVDDPQVQQEGAAGNDLQAWKAWQVEVNRLRIEAERAAKDQLAAWWSSEPVARAKAQLDSALKDLEDRGLLWWDRSSNSYDLHPIVRAYVHDQLEHAERVHANKRVHDHFQALPSEDPDSATSVEDLRQTITIFRALVGADQAAEAGRLWDTQLNRALVLELGAYATVVELLDPLAVLGSIGVRVDLAFAYYYLCRYDEAINQETHILAEALEKEDRDAIIRCLSRLEAFYADSGADLRSSRCLDLWEALGAPVEDSDGANLCAVLGGRAVVHGQIGQALMLLGQAESLRTPPNAPWFTGDIRLSQLRMALIKGESRIEDLLAAADAELHLWKHRRDLAQFRYELFMQLGDFNRALTAAQECERLERNAGLETVPAASAVPLAKLGQRNDALTAIQVSLTRLPRVHPAHRPHYALAVALWELGRHGEAVHHAHAAYRQAWRDGLPYCHHWNLRHARELLDKMGEPPPDLPTVDPATVKIPLEDEIRAFITKLNVEG